MYLHIKEHRVSVDSDDVAVTPSMQYENSNSVHLCAMCYSTSSLVCPGCVHLYPKLKVDLLLSESYQPHRHALLSCALLEGACMTLWEVSLTIGLES